MKKFYFLLVIIIVSGSVKAQKNYPFFPRDQHCYLGGFPAFYKDFHQILIEKKLKPCENKQEFFTAFVLIKPDNFIEVFDSKTAENNKCSFEIAKEVMKMMDRWIPAKIDGKEQPTVARIMFYMDDLFENYKEGYTVGKTINNAFYGENSLDGTKSFRQEVLRRIDTSNFYFKGKGILRVETTFQINEKGELEDLAIVKSSGLKEFDEMLLDSIRKTIKKNSWTPAKLHNISIKSNFRLPFSVDVN